jgi:hypothetical protein
MNPELHRLASISEEIKLVVTVVYLDGQIKQSRFNANNAIDKYQIVCEGLFTQFQNTRPKR